MTCKTQPEALRLADQLYSPAAASELRRLYALVTQDEVLLRQALEALDSGRTDIQLRTAIALRERLGEKA